jgi:hypothetical protein
MGVATKDQVDALFRVGVGGTELKGNELVVRTEEILLKNLQTALQRLGARLADNLEFNAPMDSGGLKASFGSPVIKETKTGYRIEISTKADYFDFVDKGVRGVQNKRKTYPNEQGKFYQFKNYYMPPQAIMQLQGWMQRKNMEIQATNLIEGRQMLPQISTSAKRLAYFIKKYGIEGKQFIKKSINASVPDFQLDLRTIGQDTLILKIKK